jgi:hypothetical protein
VARTARAGAGGQAAGSQGVKMVLFYSRLLTPSSRTGRLSLEKHRAPALEKALGKYRRWKSHFCPNSCWKSRGGTAGDVVASAQFSDCSRISDR